MQRLGGAGDRDERVGADVERDPEAVARRVREAPLEILGGANATEWTSEVELPPNASPTSSKTRATSSSERTSHSMTSGLPTESASSRTLPLDPLALVGERELRALLGEPPRDRPGDRALVRDAEDEAALSLEASHSARVYTGGVLSAAVAERRVAVVTGASSGIGEAIAGALARAAGAASCWPGGRSGCATLADELDGEWELCDVAERAEVEAVAARIARAAPADRAARQQRGPRGTHEFLGADPERIEDVDPRRTTSARVWSLRAFLPALEAAGGRRQRRLGRRHGRAPARAPTPPRSTRSSPSRASVTAELAPARNPRPHGQCPASSRREGFPQRGLLPGPLNRAR